MDMHPKFATWLASANITPNDDVLRKWWAGLDAFQATASNVVSLAKLAKEADATTVAASDFHASLRAHDAALLPAQKLAIAALATVKLYTIVEKDSALGDFAALLSSISFPAFETQPAYRADLTVLAEKSLAESSRDRADLEPLIDRLERDSDEESEESEEESDLDGLERILAVTAEETNILWWIFGGRSRESNEAFADIADEVIPFVAAKELADLTTLLPGHAAIRAFADRVCQTGRAKLPKTVLISAAVKKLPEAFVTGISKQWNGHSCLPLCRLTREIIGQSSFWGKSYKLPVADLSQLFYRECLVPRAWKKASA